MGLTISETEFERKNHKVNQLIIAESRKASVTDPVSNLKLGKTFLCSKCSTYVRDSISSSLSHL